MRLRQAGIAASIAALCGTLAAAPREEREPPPRPWGGAQLAYDARYLARRPFETGRRGRAKALAVAGSTVALYLLRDEIREVVQDNRSEARTDLYEGARDVFGKGWLAPTLALAAWSTSRATRNPRETETAFLLLSSMGYSTLAARAGSFVLAAERPEDGDAVHVFDTEGRGVSLDAALAASIVAPLRRQYLRVRPTDPAARRFWKRAGSTVLYAGAALTAMQRMDSDKHWAPDVFLGLASGLGCGKSLGDAHDRAAGEREAARGGLAWRLTPLPGGLALTFEPGRRGRRPSRANP
jgi:hypothetical protein